ncbi:MAG: phage holin family protein [Candidatus Levybacteria bacterium]|nr:phage holin family protein [Candidatus Levybacteria bacterium]
MKSLLRHTVFNSVSLFVLTQAVSGVKISGGWENLMISGFLLSVLNKVLRPVLNLFSLPLNAVTLGLFSFIANAIILYILTVLVPDISVSEFTFNGFSFAGFVVPVIHFSTLYAFIVSAAVLSLIINFFDWLIKK